MKFADFFEAMDAARVDYVLVGGLADSLHGLVRGTLDVDVVLAMDAGRSIDALDVEHLGRIRDQRGPS